MAGTLGDHYAAFLADATHLSVEAMMTGLASPQQHIDALRRVAATLGVRGTA